MNASNQAFAIAQSLQGTVRRPNGQSISSILASAISQLQEIDSVDEFNPIRRECPSAICDGVTSLMNKLNGLPLQSGALISSSCGYHDVDKCLNGLQKGRLYVIGARPSVGKTTLALNMALNMAKNPANTKPILFFELEMNQEEIFCKVISNLSDTPEMAFRYQEQGEEANQKVYRGLDAMSRVDENGNQYSMLQVFSLQGSFSQLEARVEEYARKFGGLSGIFIDYLQLLSTGEEQERFMTLDRSIGIITRKLKQLAVRLGVPVVVLSQLNRAIESRKYTGNAKPQLSDIRSSGEVELHSDVIMFLTADDEDTSKEVRNMTLSVGKNRSGSTEDIALRFKPEIHKFFGRKLT